MELVGLAAILLVADPNTALAAERVEKVKAEVTRVEQKWSSAKPANYSYTVKSGGPFGHTVYRVRVEGDKCTAESQYTTGNKSDDWKPDTCDYQTIRNLFAQSQRFLDMPLERLEWEADEKTGLPIKASFEWLSDLSDQSWYFVISEFRVRN